MTGTLGDLRNRQVADDSLLVFARQAIGMRLVPGRLPDLSGNDLIVTRRSMRQVSAHG